MKKIHVAGFIVAMLLILFSTVIYPPLTAMLHSKKSVESAELKIASGDLAGGLSDYQHALNLIKKTKILPIEINDRIRNTLFAAVDTNPMESHKIVEFFQINDIEVECLRRALMYQGFLALAIDAAKKSEFDDVRQGLYLAALWGGECEVEERNLNQFKRLLDYYRTKSGDKFIEADWMRKAYEGQTIATAEKAAAAPAPAPEPSAPAPPQPPKAEGKIQPPVAEQKTDKAPPAAAAKQPPAPAPSAKPAAAPATAQSASQEQKDGGAVPRISPDLIMESSGQDEKTQSGSALSKVLKPVQNALSKITGLFKRGNKKENPSAKDAKIEKPQPNKPAEKGAFDIAKETKLAAEGIISVIAVHGVRPETVYFSGDGEVVYVTFSSANIGDRKLADELKNVFKSVHERITVDNRIPLKTMVIHLKDADGSSRAHWNIEYADYMEYRDKKISGAEFRKRWKEKIF